MSITFKDLLVRHTVADLKALMDHLPGADRVGLKDELIDRILLAMSGPELKAIFSRLDPMQQAAIAEAVHHPLGEYASQRFHAKYHAAPAFVIETKDAYGRADKKNSALCLFIHYVSELSRQMVPPDLQAQLKAFIPVPPSVTLESTDDSPCEENLTTRMTEREALQELMVMLRTIDQERIQVSEKTALPSSATLRLITEKLVGGDFYPWIEKKDKWDQQVGPIKAFAWPMLLQAGGLAVRTGSRLVLSPQGIKALSAKPAEVLRGLWRKWLKTTIIDEFSRVDEIKGQSAKGRVMTAVAPRRAIIDDALRNCPIGRWIAVDDFSQFMRASDRVFAVTHNPWKLYLSERQYGSLGYEGSGGWNILQDRYILALLFEYAAALGLIDVAYFHPAGACDDFRSLWGTDEMTFLSRYDGLNDFRITALGAYVLGITEDYRPIAVPSTVKLSVLQSLRVNVTQGTLGVEEAHLLEIWAEQDSPGYWRLDQEKSLSATEKGYDILELKGFLESRDNMPLPDSVEAFIRQCERNGKALRVVGSAVLVECRDAETAGVIAAHKETGSLCQRSGTKMLVVRIEHLDKLRERVHNLGFGLVAG